MIPTQEDTVLTETVKKIADLQKRAEKAEIENKRLREAIHDAFIALDTAYLDEGQSILREALQAGGKEGGGE